MPDLSSPRSRVFGSRPTASSRWLPSASGGPSLQASPTTMRPPSFFSSMHSALMRSSMPSRSVRARISCATSTSSRGSRFGAFLEREGIELRINAECMELKKEGGRIVVGLACKDGPPLAEGSHLLLAVGREPNTQDLGLDKSGIDTDERGYIKVDDECRTSAPGVWALGEANGRGAFTHTSYNDYEIVAANLFDGEQRRISERIPAYALFIDPALGRAGMNENEARKSGKRVLAAKMPMTRVSRAREAGETQGFMKVLADADSKELLGASLLGLNADEVVHSLLDVMYARKPYTTIQRAVHIHPTVSELIPTLLETLEPLRGEPQPQVV